jgi:hypothetical protein
VQICIAKVVYSPTNAQVIVLKTILKLTSKQLLSCFNVSFAGIQEAVDSWKPKL